MKEYLNIMYNIVKQKQKDCIIDSLYNLYTGLIYQFERVCLSIQDVFIQTQHLDIIEQ